MACDGTGKDTAKVEELTSLVRERLAKSGLSPSSTVPGGAPQTDLISAVAASESRAWPGSPRC